MQSATDIVAAAFVSSLLLPPQFLLRLQMLPRGDNYRAIQQRSTGEPPTWAVAAGEDGENWDWELGEAMGHPSNHSTGGDGSAGGICRSTVFESHLD